ncbi:MAG TPA: CAP domain-containing protein [Clostridia bacterium]|nr:CAP domain-containing protein [Clostridia bacterium]
MKRINRLAILLCLLLCLAITTSALALSIVQCAPNTYFEVKSSVYARRGPDVSYSKLAKLKKGDVLEGRSIYDGWVEVVYNDNPAYISSKALKEARTELFITSQSAKAKQKTALRSSPRSSAKRLASLKKGAILPVLGTYGKWTALLYNGQPAYAESKYLKRLDASLSQAQTEGSLSDSQAEKFISLVNEYRKQAGSGKLSVSSALMAAAQIRAFEITTHFSHTRPDGSAPNSLDPNIYGENIAYGTGLLSTAQEAVLGFMDSPAHWQNAMSTNYTKTGAACLKIGDTTYWVHLFG